MRQYLTSVMGEGQEYLTYDHLILRLGQLRQTSDGRMFRMVRFVGNATAGQVVSEDMAVVNIKSAKVVDSQNPQYLEVVVNVAANTTIEKDSIQLFRDDTSLGGRLYRVQTNPEVVNDTNAAADRTFQITVIDASVGDGNTIPTDYNQGTANKAVFYATQYLNAEVIDYNTAVAAGQSRRVLGIAATKITASSDSPVYALVQVGGPCLVSKNDEAAGTGQPLIAAVAAGDSGQVQAVDAAADIIRYPVGVVRYGAAAGDSFVIADVSITS